ncbi:DUF7033 domain-containing protein [Pedobacter gandavensis]|uniref:DUF7033 domain-containing protein n=1 Tax=Pedobacter gandavensis TaxID=2679963 RepID=A0ABR6EY57_9SPHI|nr:hypothetical protein [Pedobacter gandavensis]MBB2149967.1 hypothetical protein [Pedobacter gandavensis]
MRLLVYAPLITPRIKYIFNFMFKDILGLELEYPRNLKEFLNTDAPKLCYAKNPVQNILFFRSAGLLSDHSIKPQKIKTTTFGSQSVPFAIEGSTLPFDPFAASFYFLSRYEEYLPFDDRKGPGFRASLSLQHKLGLLETPVIDEWAIILKNILHLHFPNLKFQKRDFSFKVAYSLDTAAQSNLVPGVHQIKQAIGYMNQMVKDRFGRKRKEEQLKNIRQLIAEMQKTGHATKPEFLLPNTQQRTNWEETLTLPKSYVKLSTKNINRDYSMYYSDTPGFRAGTCSPFFWYDLQMEKQSQLKIFPFAVSYAGIATGKKTNKDPLLLLNELMDHVKLVNGSFYSLWQHKTMSIA